MAKFLKTGLLLLLIFGAVWLAVIIWWQQTRMIPTETDIALYLLLLPLALIGICLLAVKTLRRTGRTTRTAAVTAAAPVEPAAAATVIERSAVIAVEVATPLGNTAPAVIEALRGNRRPGMDLTLRDGGGFPVFAARVAALDNTMLRQTAADRQQNAAAWTDEMLRTHQLLQDVIEKTLRAAVEHPAIEAAAKAPHASPALPAPRLAVAVLLGDDFPEAARNALRDALHDTIGQQWPLRTYALTLHTVAADTDITQLIEERLQALHGSDAHTPGQIDLCLIAAAGSAIGPASIDRWQSQGMLLNTTNQQGLALGEAGGALLLAAPAWVQGYAGRLRVALAPAVRAQRTNAADARRAQSEAVLPDLARSLLALLSVDAADVGLVISDADHRGARPVEVAALTASLSDQLDTAYDCLSIGAGCGYTGAASGVLTLALAAQACAQYAQPVLTALTQHPTARAVLLLEPEAATPVARVDS